MEERILFPEFRDEQLDSKYPFSDSATLVSAERVYLRPDIFLDASLYPIGLEGRLHISRIDIGPDSAEIFIGDQKTPSLASAKFPLNNPPGILRFYDKYARPAGIIVSDSSRLSFFQSWSRGTYRFSQQSAEFAATCVIPMPQIGLRGILLEDGSLFTGEVWIVGENGVVVRHENGGIRVDIVGDPLFRRRACQEEGKFITPKFVRTINGMKPDKYGNFQLVVGNNFAGDTILRVYPHLDGLKIEVVGQLLGGGVV